MDISVVICTHNRADLLKRTITSLNEARRPLEGRIEIFVVANACRDDTIPWLRSYESLFPANSTLPLRWVAEPQLGKSFALNTAIEEVSYPVIAFVDDDHRVSLDYFLGVSSAVETHQSATMFCGRIQPDWDGSEPDWVHDTGPYRIYPLPIPHFDHGKKSFEIVLGGPIPGGGNLILRREVFDRVGLFATQLGPTGHNLRGGEDSEFVQRALTMGERIQYCPNVLQYHYVLKSRLRLKYLMSKSYQRTRAVTRIKQCENRVVPGFVLRKLIVYLMKAIFSVSWARTRFYLVRLAAAYGELYGIKDAGLLHQRSGHKDI